MSSLGLALIGLAYWPFGLACSDFFYGYWTKLNWMLFPVFFWIVFGLHQQCSVGFTWAWLGIFRNGVVRGLDGSQPTHTEWIRWTKHARRLNLRMFKWACALATILVLLDSADLRSAWQASDPNSLPIGILDFDWAEAHLHDPYLSRSANLLFVVLAYAMEGALAAIALWALLLIGLHSFLFARFESQWNAISYGNQRQLILRLNMHSPLREFGMEHWNHTLNALFWWIGASCSIPLVSAISQTREDDAGQFLLKLLVPLLFAIPFGLTIVIRQARLPQIWPEVAGTHDAVLDNSFRKQALWPLDRNWASKLGIILALIMVARLLGLSLSQFPI